MTAAAILLFLVTGMAAGIVGGLLGLGGGIVLIPVLRLGLDFPAGLAAGTTSPPSAEPSVTTETGTSTGYPSGPS